MVTGSEIEALDSKISTRTAEVLLSSSVQDLEQFEELCQTEKEPVGRMLHL